MGNGGSVPSRLRAWRIWRENQRTLALCLRPSGSGVESLHSWIPTTTPFTSCKSAPTILTLRAQLSAVHDMGWERPAHDMGSPNVPSRCLSRAARARGATWSEPPPATWTPSTGAGRETKRNLNWVRAERVCGAERLAIKTPVAVVRPYDDPLGRP